MPKYSLTESTTLEKQLEWKFHEVSFHGSTERNPGLCDSSVSVDLHMDCHCNCSWKGQGAEQQNQHGKLQRMIGENGYKMHKCI